MRCGGVRRAFRAPMRLSHLSRVVAAALLAALASGCASQQTARLASLNVAATPNATVTFESIDGPPPDVFRKLVASLNDEASARRVAVVPRQAAATYRVRGYVTALVDRDKTSFAWVWDVYDANQQRALRLSGEEPTASKGGRDPWGAADDLVLRKIAQAGFSGLSNMINGTPDAPSTVPGLRGPAVASVIPEAPAAEMPASALGYAER